ncbi:type IV secretory system conjugative DNA transfer family protein [Salipiger abyssi]|uniref:Type IV secretion system protein VirD4 n=1 Tax=Salipiger abyssi TaxID=1250539 RepID=A0A1P8V123_9RHOB|nr:type IV secretory system conjugative DNA transfer family protein [Salipiger abyssi]APZ55352.1 type IV secretion system protein VirD4 [Salipiger abyssi]
MKETAAQGEETFKRFRADPVSEAQKTAAAARKATRKASKATGQERPLLARAIGPAALFIIGAVIIFSAQSNSVLGPAAEAQLGSAFAAVLAAFMVGFLPVLAFTRFTLWALAGLALVLFGLITTPGLGATLIAPLAVVGFVGGIMAGVHFFVRAPDSSTDAYGSARLARRADIEAAGLLDGKGYRVGTFEDNEGESLLRYAGQRHLLTCAPTRAGKGVSAIIPNLLTYDGSMLVIDPKGENLMITAEQRHRLGHDVQALDPWNIGASFFEGGTPSRFNPLDFLDAASPDLIENAMILADALVVVGDGDAKFWDEEAKALLMGLLLYVATAPEEAEHRHLPRVRDLLLGDDEDMDELFERMMASDNAAVRGAGARALQKEPKMRSSVLATAQSHTHFLDSPRIRENMAASDFRFGDMKREKLSIYVILPADRLSTFDRWLRLIISIAIIENARNIDVEPEQPVLFLLDEMAALGRLKPVETAFGLMAGFGMQLWGIVQDLSQLERIYGKGWETFVGNSGVLQYFGSRDKMTAEYFSALCGTKTAKTISGQVRQALTGMAEEPGSYGETGRPLFMPDELMVMKSDRQLLLVETNYPIVGTRVPWFNDPDLKTLGRNLKG